MSKELEVGGRTPHLILTLSDLQDVVDHILTQEAFCFDVETRGVVERHPDVLQLIEEEWDAHRATLKTDSPDVLARSKEGIVKRWRKELALDPLRNEVIWMGLATNGGSWAIPLGHPNGEMLTPAIQGDGSTVPPPGYRAILKSGAESMAKAKFFVPATFSPAPPQLSRSEAFEVMRPLFTSETLIKVGHNVKFDARSIRKYLGDLPANPFADTMLAQHVLNENLSSYSLENLIAANFDGYHPYAVTGKLGAIITETPFSPAAKYVHMDVRWTWLLYKSLHRRLIKDPNLTACFDQDMRVLRVLMDMEDNGINVDHRAMRRLGKELDRKLNDLLLEMRQYTSRIDFNPSSTNHKVELLFNGKRQGGLGLKPVKKTGTGAPSVDEESLTKLQNKHPVIPLLLEYSETKKMISTYVEGLLPQLNKGKLHPSFHLHRTVTGRLSSSNPNLQNIPRDGALRELFVAPPGHLLLVADYDQIELRIMCMFSHDKNMSDLFITGQDIHRGTAALVLGKAFEDVTDEERQKFGKMPNFLLGFGGGAPNLAAKTGITVDHAQNVLDTYYKRFNGITKWKQEVINQGRRQGYVTTMSGRRRRLPDLSSPDNGARSKAERQAVNAVVQGSAADLCKKAMIDCYDALQGTGAKMLVQVHDELLVAVPEDAVSEIKPLFVKAMGDGSVYDGIPLKVSCHAAFSWNEAKGK